MIQFLATYKLSLMGALIGSVGGFLYWFNIGCTTEGCMIKGSPYMSTLYAAMMGWLIFSLFSKEKKKED
jgi:hypothetical protein